MVGHQAIGPDRHAGGGAAFRQQRQIGLVIAVVEKHLLPPVAPLRHMMRHARRHDPCHPRHADKVTPLSAPVNYVLCPRNSVIRRAVAGDVAGRLAVQVIVQFVFARIVVVVIGDIPLDHLALGVVDEADGARAAVIDIHLGQVAGGVVYI